MLPKLRLLLLVAASFVITSETGESRTVGDSETLNTPFYQCLLCVYSSGPPEGHAFSLESALLFDTPEERAVNNCAACEGSSGSECHDEPQEGPCHQECVEAEEEEALLVPYMDKDAAAFARAAEAVNDGAVAKAQVEFNADRGVLQVIDCKGFVSRQLPLSTEMLAEIRQHLMHDH